MSAERADRGDRGDRAEADGAEAEQAEAGRVVRGEAAGALAASRTRIVEAAPDPTASNARSRPPGSRPTWVEVDLDAIAANVAALKDQAAAPKLMAVVKADGYGHGMAPAARAALAGGADWLAVALVEEGQGLRAAGIEAPVLVMTEPPISAIAALLDAGLTAAVYTPSFTDALSLAARQRDAGPAPVHLKLDTGMRRVGVPQADWEDALRRVRSASGLHLEGLWSHLAVADEPGNPFTAEQAREFRRGLRLAESLGIAPEIAHLCNSAATLALHDEHHDMVRPGLSIYGLDPGPGMTAGKGLEPALSWRSRLSLVKRLAPGESVSYGLRWAASREATLGTVPAGYADGVARALSNRAEVVIRGQRMPIAGTVCMDQFCVDAGDTEVAVGDEVVLIGPQGDEHVTADEWARLLGTINYEIVCSIGRRVPRVYVGSAGT